MTQPGDILAFRVGPSSGWLGKLVGWGQRVVGKAPTQSGYEHIALVDAPGSIVEGYWPRVRRRDFSPEGYPNVEVYRIKGITPDQAQKLVAEAHSHIGELYNVSGILTFGLVQLGHTVYCSQGLWQWVTVLYIALCKYDDLEGPDDIVGSPLLERIA